MPPIPKSNITSKLKSLGEEANKAQTLSHIIIKAFAGSGKTSTLVEGLRLLVEGQTTFSPSNQQADIWEELLKSDGQVETFCMTSFGTEIVKTLAERIPKHSSCTAKTLHSIGLKAIVDTYFKRQKVEPDPYRSEKILARLKKVTLNELWRDHQELADNVSELVSFCKLNAYSAPSENLLRGMIEEYGLDIEITLDVYLTVNAVLEQSFKVVDSIDYDDMIWLPVVNSLPLPKFDILFCDEFQDLNIAQQKLCLKIGRRLILCGDPRQAIYNFRGADSNSYNRMFETLQKTDVGVKEFILSTCFRCSQEVVAEAQDWVKEIQIYEDNPVGLVYRANEKQLDILATDGDLILCRYNAPLIAKCLYFLGQGQKAYIRGKRNVASGLVSLVNKIAKFWSCITIEGFKVAAQSWKIREVSRFQNPLDEKQIQHIEDRYACLVTLSARSSSIEQLKTFIRTLFEDETKEGIQLSTIHQAKGIEAKRVFFIITKGNECPSTWAKTETQREQERNLRYIGITRAIDELIYID